MQPQRRRQPHTAQATAPALRPRVPGSRSCSICTPCIKVWRRRTSARTDCTQMPSRPVPQPAHRCWVSGNGTPIPSESSSAQKHLAQSGLLLPRATSTASLSCAPALSQQTLQLVQLPTCHHTPVIVGSHAAHAQAAVHCPSIISNTPSPGCSWLCKKEHCCCLGTVFPCMYKQTRLHSHAQTASP